MSTFWLVCIIMSMSNNLPCIMIPNHLQAEKLKKLLEAELLSLRERVSELEHESGLKSQEVASAAAGKEEALSSALSEITSLKDEISAKMWVSLIFHYIMILIIRFGISSTVFL